MATQPYLPAWRPAFGCLLRSVRAHSRSRFSSAVDRPSKSGGWDRRQAFPTQWREFMCPRCSTVALLIPPHLGRMLPVTSVATVTSEDSRRVPTSWVVSARPPPEVHSHVRAPAMCCTRWGYSGILPRPCQTLPGKPLLLVQGLLRAAWLVRAFATCRGRSGVVGIFLRPCQAQLR